MRNFIPVILILLSTAASAQKYALLDKKMSLPVTYKDAVTTEDNFKGYFPVDKSKIKEFITEVDKIAKLLTENKKKPEGFEFLVGSTTFHGLRVPLATEERMDVVLSTDCGPSKITMHLSDAKLANASNVYFINTWLKYLRDYIR